MCFMRGSFLFFFILHPVRRRLIRVDLGRESETLSAVRDGLRTAIRYKNMRGVDFKNTSDERAGRMPTKISPAHPEGERLGGYGPGFLYIASTVYNVACAALNVTTECTPVVGGKSPRMYSSAKSVGRGGLY